MYVRSGYRVYACMQVEACAELILGVCVPQGQRKEGGAGWVKMTMQTWAWFNVKRKKIILGFDTGRGMDQGGKQNFKTQPHNHHGR